MGKIIALANQKGGVQMMKLQLYMNHEPLHK